MTPSMCGDGLQDLTYDDLLRECRNKQAVINHLNEIIEKSKPSPEETAYTRWLEDELAEVVRLSHRGLFEKMGGDDEITDTMRLHGIRLMIGADEERYEKLLERIKSRLPQSRSTE